MFNPTDPSPPPPWPAAPQANGPSGRLVPAHGAPHRSTDEPARQPGMQGDLTCMPGARGLVILAYAGGQGPGRAAMQQVAGILHSHQLATLALDLPDDSAGDGQAGSDPDRLAASLGAALRQVHEDQRTCRLASGLMGADDGAATALNAAARHPGWVAAVVSHGGRPDPSAARLARVLAPTLLIVGGRDPEVLRLNRSAMRALRCESRLEVVPGASHRFEEPGALETMAHLAASWFTDHLSLPRH